MADKVFTPDDLLQLAASGPAYSANERIWAALIPDDIHIRLQDQWEVMIPVIHKGFEAEVVPRIAPGDREREFRKYLRNAERLMPVQFRLVYRATGGISGKDPWDVYFDGMEAFYVGAISSSGDAVLAMHTGFEADAETRWFSGLELVERLASLESTFCLNGGLGLAFDPEFTVPSATEDSPFYGALGAFEKRYLAQFADTAC